MEEHIMVYYKFATESEMSRELTGNAADFIDKYTVVIKPII